MGIPRRAGASLVVVGGVAVAVAVLICVFAMARGFNEVASKSGRADRVLVLAAGAEAEAGSSLSHEAVASILNAPEIAHAAGGAPIASADYIAYARLPDARTGLDSFATLRGVGAQLLALRPEIRIAEGRMFNPGTRELIAGRAVQRRLEGLQVGQSVSLPQGDWKIVGTFETDGGALESQVLGSAEALLSAYDSSNYNSVMVLLNDAASYASFESTLASDPTLKLVTHRERDYQLQASGPTRQLLSVIAYFVGGIMAIGAAFAALNGMFSAIDARFTEVATLRAIGYDTFAVTVSVFVEAILLALFGAAVGAAAAWWFLNGNSISAIGGSGPAPVSFVLNVNGALIALAIACACGIGLVGGLFPAIRASRVSLARALRGA